MYFNDDLNNPVCNCYTITYLIVNWYICLSKQLLYVKLIIIEPRSQYIISAN